MRRYPWAELLRRVFEVEVLVCPHCGGSRRLLAAIHAPASIERLRALDLETLYEELGVLAQCELQGAGFVPVEPTDNLDPDEPVRRTDSVIQIGLTGRDIRNVHRRIQDLLEDVDGGRYEVFP